MVSEQLSYYGSSDIGCGQYDMGTFGQAVNYYHDSIVPVTSQQFCNQIDQDYQSASVGDVVEHEHPSKAQIAALHVLGYV